MKKARIRPEKEREVGVRPERLAVIREPEFFKRSRKMRELETLLRQKADDSRRKFEESTNAVQVTKQIANAIRKIAEDAVTEANSVESVQEKLVKINTALISIVQFSDNAASSTKSAVDRHVGEIAMLQEILGSLEPPEEDPGAPEDNSGSDLEVDEHEDAEVEEEADEQAVE